MKQVQPWLVAASLSATPLVADDLGSPIGASHLLTPGTATGQVVGNSTIVSLNDNTVIEWDSFTLPQGSDLQFNFTNPADTVVNRVTGTGVTLVGGTIESNGNVVLLSPNSWLLFRPSARVVAGSFTASGLNAEATQFFNGGSNLEFEATPNSNPTTVIRGEITSTSGDVILVGRELQVVGDIKSAGNVVAVTGDEVAIDRNAPQNAVTDGGSQIIQGGVIDAGADIAFVSQNAMSMTGQMTANDGRGRAFFRVDDGGNILTGAAGLTVRAGSAEFSVEPNGEVAFIGPVEGEFTGGISPALNEFPSLSSNRSARRTVPTSSTVTARAGTGFTKEDEKKAKRRSRAVAENVAPVRKRSFFRTRTTVTPKR
ncbi:hypothetical protein HAHE_21460 [Haloferula helveola]|uniref:Filamentous haemagglutinin FhaB/tRNA nuclease CdiA-like TPS domain-containing protein n=1 Tax=Haloferula helveola TaxID=490095 RepID=A0ABM7RA62_9BACT|nr:hypothetical protein HAHE_21460 [Haloferula helveola]